MKKKKPTPKRQLPVSPEFDYFIKANLSHYKGQYVALLGKKVIASGSNAKDVWAKALKKSSGKLPTLAKLPQEEVLVLLCK